MSDFNITTPKFGKDENTPTVFLDEAFVSDGSADIVEIDGEYRHNMGRLPNLLDDNGVQITAPINIWAIIAVDQGSKKFTVDEEVAATITANAVNNTIRINGSTGNDAIYTIDTVTEVGGDTEIVVTETIADSTADGNIFVGATPIQAQLRHIRQTNDAEFYILATAYHIFSWVNSSKQLQVKFTSLSPGTGERWELITHLDDIYATNNVDLVQKWAISTSPSGTFGDLGSASGIDVDGVLFIAKAKHLASFERYLFIGRVTYSDSSVHPQRVHWSSLGDTTDFDTTGAGDAGSNDFTNKSGFLMGFGKWSNMIIVFTTDLHYEGTLVTDSLVFSWDEAELKVGCLSADTIKNDPSGRLYWLASDQTLKEFRTPFDISEGVIKTLRNLNTSVTEFAQAIYNEAQKSMMFAIPVNASATNNVIIEFFIESGSMFIHNIPIRSFGEFTRQETFSYDNPPFSTSFANYEQWGGSWGVYDLNRSIQGFKLTMCSDYNGKIYEYNGAITDAGNDYTSTLIFSSTLTKPKSLIRRKRVNNGAHAVFERKSTGTVALSVKRDGESSWQSLGNYSLANSESPEWVTQHLPFDVAGKQFQWRLQTTADMAFLAMMFREFNIEDNR